jgi:hypothetical protein
MDELAFKRCGRCQAVKPVADFQFGTKGGRQGYCKPCLDAYKQEYYRKNKADYLTRARFHRSQRKAALRAAKNRPCADCGTSYPYYVMEFDHRPGEEKLGNVADVHSGPFVSMEVLLAEIAKCDVVCANCHRERTHRRRKSAAGHPRGEAVRLL